MRFLVDACTGGRLAKWLEGEGHDVVDLSRHGAEGVTDEAVLDQASEEKRILVTMDKDFGELIFLRNRPHAGLVRLPNLDSASRIALLGRILATHGEMLEAGAVVTVRGGRIRITPPPEGTSEGETEP